MEAGLLHLCNGRLCVMPLVALVPLLVVRLGLGFAVKVAIVFLMSLFPICINTWRRVVAAQT
jgi:ABC-type nitrate/sulfonate/bicarbonate transport system permease component